MQLGEIRSEIGAIVPHAINCPARKEGECNCSHPQTVEKLNTLFLEVLKGRK